MAQSEPFHLIGDAHWLAERSVLIGRVRNVERLFEKSLKLFVTFSIVTREKLKVQKKKHLLSSTRHRTLRQREKHTSRRRRNGLLARWNRKANIVLVFDCKFFFGGVYVI